LNNESDVVTHTRTNRGLVNTNEGVKKPQARKKGKGKKGGVSGLAGMPIIVQLSKYQMNCG